MCNFSGRLVAWMDGELAEHEAAELERHVAACGTCRECVSAYQDASRDFAAYYDAATYTALATKPRRRLPRWVPVVAATAAAAAIALVVLIPHRAKTVPAVAQVAVVETPPAIAKSSSPAGPLRPVHRTRVAAHRKVPRANWAMSEPAIQIVIPADSMFPPGAVPEGVNYIANLSLTDGSLQGIRLQP